MMAEDCAQKAENLLSSLRTTPTIPTKIDQLLKLKEVLLSGDTSLLQEFAPIVSQLHTDFPSPVRRLLAMYECSFKFNIIFIVSSSSSSSGIYDLRFTKTSNSITGKIGIIHIKNSCEN